MASKVKTDPLIKKMLQRIFDYYYEHEDSLNVKLYGISTIKRVVYYSDYNPELTVSIFLESPSEFTVAFCKYSDVYGYVEDPMYCNIKIPRQLWNITLNYHHGYNRVVASIPYFVLLNSNNNSIINLFPNSSVTEKKYPWAEACLGDAIYYHHRNMLDDGKLTNSDIYHTYDQHIDSYVAELFNIPYLFFSSPSNDDYHSTAYKYMDENIMQWIHSNINSDIGLTNSPEIIVQMDNKDIDWDSAPSFEVDLPQQQSKEEMLEVINEVNERIKTCIRPT